MNISLLQTDYINLDSSSVFGRNSERTNTVQKKCTFCGDDNHSSKKCFKRIRQKKEKACAASSLGNRQTELTPRKCFRCGSEDHPLAKFPKPPKDNEKRQKHVRFNEKGNRSCNNGKSNSDQKIYSSMASMSGNDKYPSGNFGEISQQTNWILDYGAMFHITPYVSDFISGSLEDMDKYIEVVDGHHVTAKQKGQVRIKCVTIMEILSSQRYATYFWHHIYAAGYF